MKHTPLTSTGIRTSNFSNAVQLLTTVLDLEMIHHDAEQEVARFILPSGQLLELFGAKCLWHPFTTPPEWEVIIAEIHHRPQKNRRPDKG